MSQQTRRSVTPMCGRTSSTAFCSARAATRSPNDDSFLEKGIIDSTGVLELVMFLEERFGIKVKDEELVPDNLDSRRTTSPRSSSGSCSRDHCAAAGRISSERRDR